VNAAEITSRVAALQSDSNQDNPNKAGFFEEFEVCIEDCFNVKFVYVISQLFVALSSFLFVFFCSLRKSV